MQAKRSLGGIGALYRDDALLGKVYYNLKADQPPGVITCRFVFIGDDVGLPDDEQRYRLCLEDGQYLIVTVSKPHDTIYSPYVGSSCDGILHQTMSHLTSRAGASSTK